jgi:hypothetical protein
MATTALLADYLFVGPLIQARVREVVKSISADDVLQIETMEQAGPKGGMAPMVFVLWEGDRFGGASYLQARQGSAHAMDQLWTVLLHVATVSQIDLSARNDLAGRLLSEIHIALAGWTPPGCSKPLVREQGRAAIYKTASALYPLTFSVRQYL